MKKFFLSTAILSVLTIQLIAQKPFEGKLNGQVFYENVPENMKPFVENSSYVTYHKKNKTRYESKSSKYNTISVEDHEKGVRMLLMDMNIGGIASKSATISNIMSEPLDKEEYQNVEEYKMIAGFNCQKVLCNSIVMGKPYKSISYVCRDYTMNGRLLASGPTYVSLGLETKMYMEGLGDMVMTTTKLSEEPISDALFDLTPPIGYTVTDLRAMNTNADLSSRLKNTIAPPANTTSAPANKYDGKSDSELKNMLDEAVKKEDFDSAQLIKAEVDKRSKTAEGKYGKYSTADLKKMLDEALGKEDFDSAAELKKEIEKRPKSP